ncbi:MAG: GntR family transcriptional regulator [Anaerolineaceae bacterium]
MQGLNPGDQLPPEPFLARQLSVSRAMLREVITTLVERGLLIRKHGVGTFLAPRTPFLESGLEVLESLNSLAGRIGLETEVLGMEIIKRAAKRDEISGLGLTEEPHPQIISVSRVIFVSGQPVAFLVDVVPENYLSLAEVKGSLHGSVYDILVSRGTPALAYSRTEIHAENATEFLAGQLKIKKGTALIKLEAQLFSTEEKVIDYSLSYFVPGFFKFHVMRRLGKPFQETLVRP